MEMITIQKTKDNMWKVYQGDKNSGDLGFDEMLGLLVSLTVPDIRPCLQWMKTGEEHKEWDDKLIKMNNI